jgi:hypothetical protein
MCDFADADAHSDHNADQYGDGCSNTHSDADGDQRRNGHSGGYGNQGGDATRAACLCFE